MPIKSKWILTLGILAMSPSLVMAKGPLGLPGLTKSASSADSAASSSAKSNQDVAVEIAQALRQARLVGYDLNIEYKDGTALLSGMIQDASQKAQAEKLALSVAEVKKVENRLGLINGEAGQQVEQTTFQAPMKPARAVEQAGYQASQGAPVVSPIQQTSGQQTSDVKAQNQAVAQNIAKSLQQSGMSGYDIEISYRNGVASLVGEVGTHEQAYRVNQVVSQVPGVQTVDNRLKVPAAAPMAAYQPVAYQPAGAPPEAGMYHQAPPPGMAGGYPPMPVPPSAAYGHPGPGPVNPVYNQPYLPEHAWPTYAAYPNSAAVSYPTQYSASAFPYIGPFYPYPQVPLDWREARLQWDDGQWQLKFNSKTDRWWWFFNPKNWD